MRNLAEKCFYFKNITICEMEIYQILVILQIRYEYKKEDYIHNESDFRHGEEIWNSQAYR